MFYCGYEALEKSAVFLHATKLHGLPMIENQCLSYEQVLELNRPAVGPQDVLPTHVDIVVVGAGPVGLLAANLLGLLGVDTLLVEQASHTSGQPKAVAVDDEFMRVLDWIEVADAIRRHSTEPFGIHFLSPLGFALVKVPGFITMNGFGNRTGVAQPMLEKLLLERAKERACLKIHYGCRVSDLLLDEADGPIVLLTDAAGSAHRLTARHVLACDGTRSFVRQKLGIAFIGERIDQPHLVVDLAEFPDQSPFSRFFCNPERPLNSIPSPYGGRRVEFKMMPEDDREQLVEPARIRELFDRHTPYVGVPLKIIRAAIYGFSARIAASLRHGPVFLLGDAAHVMPPFGGQGMNTGARDAANLFWKLALVLNGQAAPILLDSFERERRRHIESIIAYSVRIGRLAYIRSRSLALLRDSFFAIANLLPQIRRYFSEMRYLPKPFLNSGLVVHGTSAGELVGRKFPRLNVVLKNGEKAALDSLTVPSFALLGIHVSPECVAAAAQLGVFERLKVKGVAICLTPHSESGRSVETVTLDGELPTQLASHQGEIMVLRPDQYVAASAPPAQLARIASKMEELLGISHRVESHRDKGHVNGFDER